jgi:serine/threonine protein kinase
MPTATCPSNEDLKAYAWGGLPSVSEDRLADHLDSCQRCEAALQALERRGDSLLAQLRKPVKPDPYQQEPECRQVVNRLLDDTVSFGGKPATSAPAALPPLTCPGPFREYDLLEILGEGGMGTVYKARHRKLNKLAAIKILPSGMAQDPERIARFKREMKAIGQLDHTHIVRALDAGEAEGRHYLALEYVEGLDLSKVSDRAGRLSVADACEVVRQVAVGLRAADEQGLIHRDIKPSNLMLTPKGQVKILDLGLAVFETDRPQHGDTTAHGQIVGTPDYIAPEQINDAHSVDARADIYSLGCTLYKLLTGQAPYNGPRYKSHAEKLAAHLRDPIPSIRLLLPQVPEKLAALVDRMVVKDRELRIAKPGQLVDELARFCAGADLTRLAASPRPNAEDEAAAKVSPRPLGEGPGVRADSEPASPNLPSPAGPSATGKDAKKTDFDPYHKWLGIPPIEQPPTHYRLLGVQTFESDPEVILGAVMRQSAHLKTFQLGQHAALTQKILTEVSAAKVCLLDPQRKAAYDDRLRKELEAREKAARVDALPVAKAIAEAISAEPVPAPEVGLADLFSRIDGPAPQAGKSAIGRKTSRPAAKGKSAASPGLAAIKTAGRRGLDAFAALRAAASRYTKSPVAWVGLSAAGIAAAVLFAVVMSIQTSEGTVRIELSDPAAKVTVKVDGNSISIDGLKDPIRLRVGDHKLRVESGDFKTVTESFTVWQGKTDVLTVRLEPKKTSVPVPVPTPVPNPPPVDAWTEWKDMFDGKTLDGWRQETKGAFAQDGVGSVNYENGELKLSRENGGAVGVAATGTVPRTNYEIEVEAMRVSGSDFASLHFPVGDACCTLMVGAGADSPDVVALDTLDGERGFDNETAKHANFESGRWCLVRLRVTDDRIQVWIDKDQVTDLAREGHAFGLGWENSWDAPLGIYAWSTGAAAESRVRSIRIRQLKSAAGAAKSDAVQPKIVFGEWFPIFNSPDKFYDYLPNGDVCYHNDRIRYYDKTLELHNSAVDFKVVAKDASIRARAKWLPGSGDHHINLTLRSSASGCYRARFFGDRRFDIIKRLAGNPYPIVLATTELATPHDDFFDFEFSAIGETLTVSVDGQPILSAQDSSHTEGAVAFGSSAGGNGLLRDMAMRLPSKESLVADNRDPLPPREPDNEAPDKAEAAGGAHKMVDLLKLVDLSQDVIRGNWWRFGDGSIGCEPTFAAPKYEAVVNIPYVPPQEYDYRIVFVSTNANDEVEQNCAANGRRFGLGVGEYANTITGFRTIDGKWTNANPTTRNADHWLVPGRRHVSVVKVRKDSMEAWLDGTKIISYETDWSDVGVPGGEDDTIGLGGRPGMCVESATVTEITGEGKKLRATEQ